MATPETAAVVPADQAAVEKKGKSEQPGMMGFADSSEEGGLNGVQKMAVLLTALGPERSKIILQHFSDEQIEVKIERRVERSSIAPPKEGQYREVRAALLQVFESTPLYAVCGECATSIKDKCEAHPDAATDYELVASGIIDDGTESIRAVFFKENVEKILGMSKTDIQGMSEKRRPLQSIFANVELGKEFIFEGRTRNNTLFQRLEFIVNNVKNVDVKEEIRMLAG